jgi:outer membrane protein
MRRLVFVLSLASLLAASVTSYAIEVELAVGGWRQSPDGELAYKPLTANDTLDLESDLKYDDELRMLGRVRLLTPLFFPNIYVMATPMEFDGTGRKAESFKFGDETFTADVDFYSKLTLNYYDIALFYKLPLLKKVTAKKFSVDLGLNVRIVDFEAEIRQDATGFSESESSTLPVPMVFIATQVRPIERLTIEAEGRGISYSGNHLYSLIGRLKVKAVGPLFVAGGLRYDALKIDEKDVEVDTAFIGPFMEVGLQF